MIIKSFELKNLEIFKADIADYNKVYKKFKNVKYVFHLAALADIVPSIENPKKYYKTNLITCTRILTTIYKNQKK